ncbi:TRNA PSEUDOURIDINE SYNTHASE B (TRNA PSEUDOURIDINE 55 SYNTHASE) (PSI55 SYNTHASE) (PSEUDOURIDYLATE SYNTHASE) (URACIL HYDROLYASE) [Mycoplasmopsis pulmonis]|uniref:tRNA pseudouridine synthase B n=1 Tax=Mycoplasmopsis pulmonis (strain UAB CTIP) TaxID=272635 RepID=TRUB_MYCPU|nr:tRNA pseudouridine(55) synthase TruB [Mycoplasmopsis pulmonis]Q98Q19.1 RecName: Full=tRNA pseudouridine synthase B; AltName: Full=tRNA pseudouridine(55) synthase; Short=Psi55 synthase; AltName: Full=tRNA pseudouridylate synthase; AltName: Full=tRNA-uridine isomerase [Mycoplasmopsis pulmonis UAB CTIP]CAC13723.1 TRNA PSEUDOURIDINE SYNTHASE B (TRNA PSEUDOURIDINE 55 SYNTHASE) (PSI55 SYNTHASE) (PSEUDOURIDYLATE SYNTHASE) (URACIL HYDROLYASE) [Mycoplasmopsis pulmonis]
MFYLIYKEKGISSFKAIKDFAWQNNIKKIGHSGTLDPEATGLLLLASDEDTKLLDYVDKKFKSYRATMILGLQSQSFDSQGKIINSSNLKVDNLTIEKTIKNFVGPFVQIPPIFSAKKINGKRAYEYARQGSEISMKAQEVFVKSIEIEKIDFPKVIFKAKVSRGTYIRSLINQIGLELKTYALMDDLERIELSGLSKNDLGVVSDLDIIDLEVLSLEKHEILTLAKGQKFSKDLADGKYAFIYKNTKKILGICKIESKIIAPIKIFNKKIEKSLKKDEKNE